MANSYFVSGIGTDIGKTISCAVLAEAFKADYWKPIQAGNIESSDPMIIQNLITNTVTEIHIPSYSFELPASPHFAAEKEGIDIEIDKIKIPKTKNTLFIEGAGGLLVPVNRNELVIDLIEELNVPVILVVRNYLGAINHTLLSIEALKQRRIKLTGVIYNGGNRLENIDFIEKFTGARTLGSIPEMEVINKETISREAAKFAGLTL
jgi:dethiobiotin synthetase